MLIMGRYVEIRMQRCLLCLTERELLALLAREPELWALALKRGKGALRAEKARQRKKVENIDYGG